MKFFNKTNISFIIIIFLSIALRFLFLNSPEGFTYDELTGTYNEINQPNVFAVIAYVFKNDIHMPLYQIILYGWSKIFSYSDFSLKAFSALCGIFTVLMSYFIGKELKDKQTGLICASIFTINAFLIYYSQEARMYSFLALLASAFLFFTLKIKNDYKNKWNYFWFVVFAFAIIASYTVSIIFVIAQILVLTAYLLMTIKDDRKIIIKSLLISTGILALICIPIFGTIILNKGHYTEFFNSYSSASALLILQNWFTPVIDVGGSPDYFQKFISSFGLSSLAFIILPITISIGSIIYSFKKDKFSIVILGSAVLFLIGEIAATKFTSLKIIPRYTITILPSLLILVGYGISLIEKKHFRNILLSLILSINILHFAFAGDSIFRTSKGGLKPLAQMLISNNIEDNDFIVVWNKRTVLDKYIDKKLNIIGLLANVAYTSEVILNNEAQLNKLPVEKRKEILRPYFASTYIPQNNIYLINAIYNHMKPDQKFIITTNSAFDSYTQESFTKTVNGQTYKNIPYNNLLCIKALIDLKKLSKERFHLIKRIQDRDFVVIIYKK